jgi:hypothetical protein
MPWNPPHTEPPLPPRLAVYAHRVAEVLKDCRPVGFLLVEPEPYAEQVGGALWWRRWSEYRWAAHLWLNVPGLDLDVDVADSLVAPEDLIGPDWAGRQAGRRTPTPTQIAGGFRPAIPES